MAVGASWLMMLGLLAPLMVPFIMLDSNQGASLDHSR